jgi:hypothetical protein
MTEDAPVGSREMAAAGPAENLGKLYCGGCLLLAVATIAIGFGCFFEPWLENEPKPVLALFSFHTLTGVALIACALGIAASHKTRMWAAFLGAAALLAAIDGAVFP